MIEERLGQAEISVGPLKPARGRVPKVVQAEVGDPGLAKRGADVGGEAGCGDRVLIAGRDR